MSAAVMRQPRSDPRPRRPPIRPASSSYRPSSAYSARSSRVSFLEPITTPDEESDDESPSTSRRVSFAEPADDASSTHRSSSPASTVGIDTSPAYVIAPAPTKGGSGLFATRPISKGALILLEKPLFTLPPPPTRTNSMVLAALAQRTREEQRDYFTLSNAYKTTSLGKPALLPALGIFETNALPCGPEHATTNDGREGVFMTGSRLNHSCRPNVARAWDDKAGAIAFRALCDVAAGEELSVNYVDVLGVREQRAAELLDEFRFECKCEVCGLEGEELEESDKRRSTIRRLFEEVGTCGKEPTLGMRKAKLALRMLAEEGLVHYETSFCFDAFQLCVVVSDFANAKRWIKKAYDVSCQTSGPDSAASRNFKMYWANPRAHELSGLMSRMTLSGPD